MRWWNPNDNRIITPKSFGWGYDFNLNALLRRLHLPVVPHGSRRVDKLHQSLERLGRLDALLAFRVHPA